MTDRRDDDDHDAPSRPPQFLGGGDRESTRPIHQSSESTSKELDEEGDDQIESFVQSFSEATNSSVETANRAALLIRHWANSADWCCADGTPWASGHLKLLSPAGQGGMGCVYKAQIQGSNEGICAIKIPRSDDNVLAIAEAADGWDDSNGPTNSKIAEGVVSHLRGWISEVLLLNWLSTMPGKAAGVVPCLDNGLKLFIPKGEPSVTTDKKPAEQIEQLTAFILRDMLESADGYLKYKDHPPWLAMPWQPKTLALRVAEAGGRLPFAIGRHILIRIAETLANLHQFHINVIHRDLKPSNVLLDEFDRPLLSDFGVAIDRDNQKTTGNPAGSGTPTYMSPEVEQGLIAESSSDVFLWGQTAYRVLTGRDPRGELTRSTERRVRAVSIENQGGVPPYFAELVNQCLENDASKRPSGFPALLESISIAEDCRHAPPLDRSGIDKAGRIPSKSIPKKTGEVLIKNLQYSERWLPYIQNDTVEAKLDQFISDARPFCWWGIIGEGGVGKSRTAQDLLDRYGDLMEVGFLRTSTDRQVRDWLEKDVKEWRPVRPTLIVVDYSVRFSKELVVGLTTMAANSKYYGQHARVRLLFLDRPGPDATPLSLTRTDEPWSTGDEKYSNSIRSCLYGSQASNNAESRLAMDPETTNVVSKRLDDASRVYENLNDSQESRDTQSKSSYKSETNETGSRRVADGSLVFENELLWLTPPKRDRWLALLNTMLDRFDIEPSIRLPGTDAVAFWDRVDRLTGGGRYLFLQLFAVCLARNPDRINELVNEDADLESLLMDMISYEMEHHWRKLLPASVSSDKEHSAATLETLRSAIAFITLAGGVMLPEDGKHLKEVCGQTADLTLLSRLLKKILHPRSTDDGGNFVPGLEPDLLGERLILSFGSSSTSKLESGEPVWFDEEERALASAGAPFDEWLEMACRVSRQRTVETLVRLVRDFPSSTAVRSLVAQLLVMLDEEASQTPITDPTEEDPLRQFASESFAVVRDFLAAQEQKLNRETFSDIESLLKTVQNLGGKHPAVWRGALKAFASDHFQSPIVESLRKQMVEVAGKWQSLSQCVLGQLRGASYIAWRVSGGNSDDEPRLASAEDWTELTWNLYATTDDACEEVAAEKIRSSAYMFWVECRGNSSREDKSAIAGNRWLGQGSSLAKQARWSENEVVQAAYAEFIEILSFYLTRLRHAKLPQRWVVLNYWLEQLRELAGQSQWQGNEAIQVKLAILCVNTISHFANAATAEVPDRWDRVAHCLAVLEELASREQWQDNAAIQEQLAMGYAGAATRYGDKGTLSSEVPDRWDRVAQPLAMLQDLAGREQWQNTEPIQVRVAVACLHAVVDYGNAATSEVPDRWDRLAEQLEVLEDLARREQWQESEAIQGQLASACVSAIVDYGSVDRSEVPDRWDRIARRLEVLEELAGREQWRDNEAIQVQLAMACAGAATRYGDKGTSLLEVPHRWDRVAHRLEMLQDLAGREQWQNTKAIQVQFAASCLHAIVDYGNAATSEVPDRWDRLAEQLEVLEDLARREQWQESEAIQRQLASACVSAIVDYGSVDRSEVSDRWDRMARRLEVLEELAGREQWQNTEGIQFQLARACRIAAYFQAAGDLLELPDRADRVEACCKALQTLANQPIWHDHEGIQSEWAKLLGLVCFALAEDDHGTDLGVLATEWSADFVECCRSRRIDDETVELLLHTSHTVARTGDHVVELAQEVHAILKEKYPDASSQGVDPFDAIESIAMLPESLDDETIQVKLAKACFQSIGRNSDADSSEVPDRWERVAHRLEVLEELASREQWRGNEAIQVQLAMVCVNTIVYYANAELSEVPDRWDRIARRLEVLEELAGREQWQDNEAIQVQLAMACAGAATRYGDKGTSSLEVPDRWDRVAHRLEMLQDLAGREQWQNTEAIQVRFAASCLHAIVDYGNAATSEVPDRWDRLAEQLEVLEDLARQEQWQESEAIQGGLASACVSAIVDYGSVDRSEVSDRWDRMARRLEVLEELAGREQWQNTEGIQFQLARACRIAAHFQAAGDLLELPDRADRVEACCKTLQSLANQPIWNDHEAIQSEWGKLLNMVCFALAEDDHGTDLGVLATEWSADFVECCRSRRIDDETVELLLHTSHTVARTGDHVVELAQEVHAILKEKYPDASSQGVDWHSPLDETTAREITAPLIANAQWPMETLFRSEWQPLQGRQAAEHIHLLYGALRDDPLVQDAQARRIRAVRIRKMQCYENITIAEFLLQGNSENPDCEESLVAVFTGDDQVECLDGKANHIHALNQEHRVDLGTERNAIEYLHFFCGLVQGEEGPFNIIASEQRLSERIAEPEEFSASELWTYCQPIKIERIPPSDANSSVESTGEMVPLWKIRATVQYSHALFNSTFVIYDRGMVERKDDEAIRDEIVMRYGIFNRRGYRQQKVASSG